MLVLALWTPLYVYNGTTRHCFSKGPCSFHIRIADSCRGAQLCLSYDWSLAGLLQRFLDLSALKCAVAWQCCTESCHFEFMPVCDPLCVL